MAIRARPPSGGDGWPLQGDWLALRSSPARIQERSSVSEPPIGETRVIGYGGLVAHPFNLTCARVLQRIFNAQESTVAAS